MFFDVSDRFFCAEFKLDEFQLEKFEHFCRFKVKDQEMKLGVIPHFYVILTGQSISDTILIIQGHLQGQQINFKVK